MDRDGAVLRRLDAILPSGLVLDVGAGNGYTAERLVNGDRRVVPVEPASGMIRRDRCLPWVRGFAQELPFKPGSFDAAYATWAYFFPSSGYGPDGLAELHRIVRRGGPLLIIDNAGGDEFCSLFNRDIASDPGWWREKGFDCELVKTSFKFDSLAQAEELLAFYWKGNGRRNGAEPTKQIGFNVAVFSSRSSGWGRI